MRRKMSWVAAFLALGLWIVPAGAAFAGDANAVAFGDINADDVSQGSGTQVNGDDWDYMNNALVGSGNQSSQVWGNANTGSGVQDDTESLAFDWFDIDNANAGSGAQVINSSNSNGRDRNSSDVVFELAEFSGVANAALEGSVSGNSVTVAQGGTVDSDLSMSNSSGFAEMYGISAVAASAGANASQNVSVDVTAQVRVATP